jgi:hypothetical protein
LTSCRWQDVVSLLRLLVSCYLRKEKSREAALARFRENEQQSCAAEDGTAVSPSYYPFILLGACQPRHVHVLFSSCLLLVQLFWFFIALSTVNCLVLQPFSFPLRLFPPSSISVICCSARKADEQQTDRSRGRAHVHRYAVAHRPRSTVSCYSIHENIVL